MKKKKVKRKISKPKKVRVHKNVVRKKRKHVSIQPRHSVRHIVRRVLQTMPVKHLITPSFMPESIPLVSKPIAVSKTSEPVSLLDEEPNELIALRLVKLYFEDIARLGFKRNLELDSLIDAYFYILQRLKNKDKELQAMANRVKEQETKMALESKEELFPTLEKE